MTLSKSLRILAEPLDLPVRLERLSNLARNHLRVDLVRLWLRQEPQGELRLAAKACHRAAATMSGELGDSAPQCCRELARKLEQTPPHELYPAEPRAARDVAQDRTGKCRLQLAAPLWMEDEWLGLLAFMNRRRRKFSAPEIALVRDLATSMVVAVRQHRGRRRDSTATLEEISRVAASGGDVLEVLREMCLGAARLCGARRGTVFLWQDKARRLAPALSRTAPGEAEEARRFEAFARTVLPQGIPLLSRVVNTCRPVGVTDTHGSPLVPAAWVLRFQIKSVLVAPLVSGGTVCGALMVDAGEAQSFGQRHMDFAVAVAGQMTRVLQQALLDQETADQLRQSQAHLGIADSLGATSEPTPLLEEIAQQAARACAMERCFLFLKTGDRMQPILAQRADGRRSFELRRALSEAAGQGESPLLNRALATKEPLVMAPNTESLWPQAAQTLRHEALLLVPLVRHGVSIGALVLDNYESTQPVSRAQVGLGTAIAGQIALVLDNARLHAETADRLRQTEAVLKITRTLGSSLETRPRLKDIVRHAARACDTHLCSIYLWRESVTAKSSATAASAAGTMDPKLWRETEPSADPASKPPMGDLAQRPGTVVVHNEDAAPRFPALAALESREALLVPLARQDRIMGAMVWSNAEGQGTAITQPQEALARNVASQVAVALDNARLYQTTQRRLRQTEIHLQIARILTSALDLVPLLERVTQLTAQACGMDHCSIHLFREDRALSLMSQYGDGRRLPKLWRAFRALDGTPLEELPHLAQVRRTGEPVVIHRVDDDPLWIPELAIFESKAVMVVPLIRQGAVVGALVVGNREPTDGATPEQVASAQTIASQVALAMENSDLYRETQERLRRTEDHVQIARTFGSTLEIRPLLEEMSRQAARICGMDHCTIVLVEGGWLVPMSRYSQGTAGESAEPPRRVKVAEVPWMAETVHTREPVIVNDSPVLERDTKGALLAVPLVRQGEVVGAMLLGNSGGPKPIREHEVALGTTLASQVALALDNARLYAETQLRLCETRALLRVAQTLGASLDRQEIARRTIRELTRLVGADTSIFLEVDESTGYGVGIAGYQVPKHLQSTQRLPLQAEAPFVQEALATGRPVATSDLANDPRFDIPLLRNFPTELRSLVYAPVMSQGKRLGVLASIWWTGSHRFTDEELSLVEGIAHQMALFLKNAHNFNAAQKALADLKAAQDRLVQSEKLQALAEMAGGVAHDFNNLLTAILGQTELLRHQIERSRVGVSAEVGTSLEVIEDAAQDGAETVRRLLDYTRAKPHTEAVTVDVNELLAYTREVARPRWRTQARHQGIEIEVVMESHQVPTVWGHPGELREVVLNLVLNAIDAMPEGGILTLSSGASRNEVWLKVKDTGVGMPEEVRQRIFDPFFTTKGEGSSGLGLSASYGIIQRHRGKIEVTSEPGRGTTFTVRLPSGKKDRGAPLG